MVSPAYRRSERGRVYYPETFHPSADEPSKATVVEVATGRETTDVDITVGRPLKALRDRGPTYRLSRRVRLYPNVGVRRYFTASANGRVPAHLGGAFSSNASGEFRIPNALPGHYVVAPENDRVSNTYGDPILST
jgi:hypothetical protein